MFIEIARYTQPPTMNVATAMSLSSAIAAAAPAASPPAVQKCLEKLTTRAGVLGALWKDEEVTIDARPQDYAVDNGWGGVHGRLVPYERLDETTYPSAATAARLRAILFPDGLTFLTLPYKQEWAESEKRFERIKKEGLEADLRALAGSEFVDALEHAHTEYGRILGITAVSTQKDAAALREPLRALCLAISDYAVQLAAAVHAEENEEAAKLLLAGLAPIDAVRDWRKKRRPKGGAEDVVEPVVPAKPEGEKPTG